MRLRNVKNKEEILNNCKIYINNPIEYKGKWHKIFKNNNPIQIEIGSGKCQFIKEMAKKHRNINFIAIEKYASVLAMGLKNYDAKPDNLKIINIDAKELNNVFQKEIDCIYLNFSDPWPKKRHYKRRLTSSEFLSIYDGIFKKSPKIIQKTDNMSLFEYSICSLTNHGYKIEDISLDLHKRENDDNINTEYEEKFIKKGFPIYMLKATKDIE